MPTYDRFRFPLFLSLIVALIGGCVMGDLVLVKAPPRATEQTVIEVDENADPPQPDSVVEILNAEPVGQFER